MAAAQIVTINPEAFAEALQELPLSSVHGKISELRNSIAHLHRSNAEMKDFKDQCTSEEEKAEMEGYIRENEGVFASMRERLGMLRVEIERRGLVWTEEGSEQEQGQDGQGRDNKEEEEEGQEGGEEKPVVNGDAEEGVYL